MLNIFFSFFTCELRTLSAMCNLIGYTTHIVNIGSPLVVLWCIRSCISCNDINLCSTLTWLLIIMVSSTQLKLVCKCSHLHNYHFSCIHIACILKVNVYVTTWTRRKHMFIWNKHNFLRYRWNLGVVLALKDKMGFKLNSFSIFVFAVPYNTNKRVILNTLNVVLWYGLYVVWHEIRTYIITN